MIDLQDAEQVVAHVEAVTAQLREKIAEREREKVEAIERRDSLTERARQVSLTLKYSL